MLRVLLERGFNVKILVRDPSKLSTIFLKLWKELLVSIQEIMRGDLALNDGATKDRIFPGMRDCTVVYHWGDMGRRKSKWNGSHARGGGSSKRMFVHISALETITVSGGLRCPSREQM